MKPARLLAFIVLTLATAAVPATEISLSSADAAFLGEQTDDTAGHQISIIGDINNDSYDDFIITAPGWDQNENSQNNGAAYLYYGTSSGFSGTSNLALADAIFIGNTGQEAAHDAFGIGDVDNDGYNDFAIGLKKYHAVVVDTLRNKVGKVYIFFGGPTPYTGAVYLESAGASLEGTNAYAEAAHIKGVGDVNGDEYDDIIVGAGFHSQIGPEAGKTYLFLGKARSNWSSGDKMEDVADATFLAENEGDWAGHRVADVGDVNGDGLTDFIIGANYYDANETTNTGKVYLILGKETGWAPNTPLTDADASWVGTVKNMGLGWNVGNPGDIDGDGLNDIIMGGAKYEAFLILGKNISYSTNQSISTAADVSLSPSENLADDIGHDMHSLGDVNGDGIDDFIVGGSNLTDELLGAKAGKAFVFYGRDAWSSQMNFDDADIIYTAENAGDAAGFSVAGDGDVNNDGINDILISAKGYDNNTGKVYLFHSTETSLTLLQPNGGEILSAGEYTKITWMPDPDVTNVTLELSTDNGNTWETIVENISDDAEYSWLVPSVSSENCLVRIRDAADGDPMDQSNSVFTITNEATITVLAPNGGEFFTAGQSVNIQWSSFNFNENVKIELSVDNGITWDAITVDTENDGSYAWTVPDRPTTTGRIRVTGSPTYTIQDASDATFTIAGSNLVLNRIEAEDAKLSPGYEVEERPETSNGKVVRLAGSAVGSISYNFDLPVAEYELFVRYLDEIDGISNSNIKINQSKVAEWQWDEAESSDVYLYRSFGTFQFNKNDDLEIRTRSDNGEYARVDYFEFVRVDEPLHNLTVLSPNGGEEWEIGSAAEVVWSAENTSGFYNIQLTRDAGASWETLLNNIGVNPASDGNLRVTITPVSGPASDSCLVKVVDVDGAPVDQSDDFFSIVEPPEPSITVTSPNGGEEWMIDSVVTITWDSENTSGDVKIELRRMSGGGWQTLTESTDDDGDFEWRVVGPPADECLIRISDIDKDVSDTSDAVFDIKGTPKLVVTTPNGGESWDAGSTQTIRWTSEYVNGNVKIDVTHNGGTDWSSVVENIANNGAYDWLVSGPETTSAQIRVTAMDSSASDTSDANFTIITPPSISVTSPNGGEEWFIGRQEFVAWDLNKVTGTLDLELSRDGGQTWEDIGSASASAGEAGWTVTPPATAQALVRISTQDGAVIDVSDDVFSISEPPSFTITAPKGGEEWVVGTREKITWDSYKAGAHVKIDLSRDGGDNWQTISDSTANSGEYEWLVSLPASDNCLVRIIDVSGFPADTSDSYFTIRDAYEPTLTLATPNGGEQWVVESLQTVTWVSAHLEGTIKIELSRNNGSDWETLAESTEDDGQFSWTVTEPVTDNALVRVSSSDGQLSDQSDAVFKISAKPSLTILSPNGGETWPIGTSRSINWTSVNTSGAVKIELSRDNGANWETLVDSTHDDGEHDIIVTGPASENCLLMISDIDGAPYDVSDAFFKIDDPLTITVLSPNGGEVWRIGTQQEISWTADNISDTLHIQLSRDNGSTWELLTKTENSGRWTWTVTGPVSETSLIRVYAPISDLSDDSDGAFKIDVADGVARMNSEIPTDFALEQNYPNPFNPVTRIQYSLPAQSDVRLEIYNAIGTQVATLVNERQSAGAYILTWNGKDDFGNQMSSGLYFYRISAEGFTQTRRMMLMK